MPRAPMPSVRRTRRAAAAALLVLAVAREVGRPFVSASRLGFRSDGRVRLAQRMSITAELGSQVAEVFDDFWDDAEDASEQMPPSVPASCLTCTGEVCVVKLEEAKADDDARLLQALALTVGDEEVRHARVRDFIESRGPESDALEENYRRLESAAALAGMPR